MNCRFEPAAKAQAKSDIAITFMNMTDMRQAAAIERACFARPWTLDDFRRANSGPYTTCRVADIEGSAAGYVVYTLLRDLGLYVERIGVAPDARRRGVGRTLVGHVEKVLRDSDAVKVVTLKVRESNLEAQLFWRAMGYRCVWVRRRDYNYPREDAYLFERRFPECSGR